MGFRGHLNEFGGVEGKVQMVLEADSTRVIGSGEGEDPFPLGTSQGGR